MDCELSTGWMFGLWRHRRLKDLRAPPDIETHGWRTSGMFLEESPHGNDVHRDSVGWTGHCDYDCVTTPATVHTTARQAGTGSSGQNRSTRYMARNLQDHRYLTFECPPVPVHVYIVYEPYRLTQPGLFMPGPASNGRRSEPPHETQRAGGMGAWGGGQMGCLYRHPGHHQVHVGAVGCSLPPG